MNNDDIDIANKYMDNGNYQKAYSYYQLALARNPNDIFVQGRLANCLVELGRYSEANKECKSIIELDENYAPAYQILSMVYERQNRLPEAEDAIRQALRLDPGMAIAYHLLGSIMVQRDCLEEALDAYTRAIQIQPTYWKAYFNRAVVLRASRFSEKALQDNWKAFKLAPSFFTAYWTVVSLELKNPFIVGIVNISLLIIPILVDSIYIAPLVLLLLLAVTFRALTWFRANLRARGIITIILGLLVVSWYLCRVLG